MTSYGDPAEVEWKDLSYAEKVARRRAAGHDNGDASRLCLVAQRAVDDGTLSEVRVESIKASCSCAWTVQFSSDSGARSTS